MPVNRVIIVWFLTEIEKEKEKQKIFPVLCTYISHLLYLYKEVEIKVFWYGF